MQTRHLSFWNIWTMSIGFMGIQFGWGLQMANMSAIYGILGAKESELAILWIAAPLTGLIVHPIIGYMSDRTWNRFGRRKPYILFGALLSSLALIAMPNSSTLWMAVGLLWVLDGAINVSMQPFRSFVADLLPEAQRPLGFSVQTALIGIGAVVSSALPWLLVNGFGVASEGADSSVIPPSVMLAFYIGAAVMMACVLLTVLSTKEQPPHDMQEFLKQKEEKGGLWAGAREILRNLSTMPPRMKSLAFVQLFTWAGLFSMWTYFTPVIARNVFASTEATSIEYHHATEWAGVCFSVYNGMALLMAFVFMALTKYFSARHIHIASLICGGLGLASVSMIQDASLLIVAMAAIGIAWASILAMPYVMLAGALPPKKMGVYMGIFNLFIVIPQVIVAIVSGPLVENLFDGNSSAILAIGGLSMLIAALLTLRVDYHFSATAGSELYATPEH